MTKQVIEVGIPEKFDFIELAEKLTTIAKSPKYELKFKTRPQEYWGSDPLIPQTKEHFEEMLHHLSKFNDISADVETSGLSYVDPNVRICGHVFTTTEKSFYVPIRHNTEEWQLDADYVNKVLANEVYGRKDAVLNFHNVAFDYNQLLKDEIDISWRFKEKAVVDTQIMYWLLDENQKDDKWYYILHEGRPAERTKWRQGLKGHANKARQAGAKVLQGFSLKVLAPKLFGIPMTKFDDLMKLVGFQNLPIHFGGAYARVDGIATHKLKQEGMPKIYEEKLDSALFNVEMPFARVVGNMERRGMGVNIEALDEMEQRAEREIKELEETLMQTLGTITFSTKSLTELFIEEYGLPVLKKTDKGNPSFDEEAMDLYEEYLQEHKDKYDESILKIPSMIIRLKKLQKTIGTYTENIRKFIDVDARIHTSLHQTGTITGRLSSSDPNLQNLPTKPVFVDELPKEEFIQLRKEIGDLGLNKKYNFSIFFLEDIGGGKLEPIGMEEGWEERVKKVEMRWFLRDLFSEKGFTPENKLKYQKDYHRFGEIDAYVKDGKLVTIDLTKDDWLYTVSD